MRPGFVRVAIDVAQALIDIEKVLSSSRRVSLSKNNEQGLSRLASPGAEDRRLRKGRVAGLSLSHGQRSDLRRPNPLAECPLGHYY